MQELMLFMAKAMPLDFLVESMEKAIQEYKAEPTKETRNKIGSLCMLFNSKEVIDAAGGDVLKIMKDFQEKSKVIDMVDMKNNVS